MTFDAGDTAPLLERWGGLIEAAPRELTSFQYLYAQRGAPPIARAINVFAGADTDATITTLTPLVEVAPLVDQSAQLAPYAAIVPAYDASHYGGPAAAREPAAA
jgi:hypothetical protein